MEKRSLRYKRKQMVAPQPPVIPSGALSNKDCHNITESETMYSTRREYYRVLKIFLVFSCFNNFFYSFSHA